MQVKKEEKRLRIINAATDLFVEKGLDNVSMNDVAKKARVGKGTLYLYFSSKEDMIASIVERVYDSFTEDIINASNESNNAEEFISKLIDNMFKNMERRGRILSMLHKSAKVDERIFRHFRENYRKALKDAYGKFSEDFSIKFDEFYFLVTSLLMSSHILSKAEDPNWVKKTSYNLIKKAAL